MAGFPGIFVNVDGACGVDNAFSALATGQASQTHSDKSLSNLQTARSLAGGWTLLIRLDDLGVGGSQTNLTGAVLNAAPRATPSFTPTEVWAPTAESFSAGEPLVRLEGFVAGGLLVSTTPFSLDFLDEFFLFPGFRIPLSRALILARLSADGMHLDGTLSGVISGAALQQRVDHAPTCILPESSTPLDHYFGDVLLSGDVEPSRYCDAISFGVIFTAERVTLGEPAAPVGPLEPCSK